MIVVPRDEANRYRLYSVGRSGMRLLATGPDGASIGTALVVLRAEGEFTEEDRVGILDTLAREDLGGRWIANPFA